MANEEIRLGGAPALFGSLRPRVGYQTVPIELAFDWARCLRDVDRGTWYVVAFRSQRRPGADSARIEFLDNLAFEEASRAGGLITYFKGTLDEQGRCLSVCVWEDRDRARRTVTASAHREAAAITHEMYVWYRLERRLLRKAAGSGTLEWTPLS